MVEEDSDNDVSVRRPQLPVGFCLADCRFCQCTKDPAPTEG